MGRAGAGGGGSGRQTGGLSSPLSEHSPPCAQEKQTPCALSQPRAGVCQNRTDAQRARLIYRQEEKLIRAPAGMITWGREPPADDGSSGSSRWRETPASRHRELSGRDRQEARKVGMVK